MEILLQANANINAADDCGFRPIDIACLLGLPEAVRFLDQFGCNLEFDCPIELVGTAIDLVKFTDQSGAETLKAVLEIIANRRRKLQTLVSDTLPEAVTNFLHLSEDKVIDEYAASAMDLLERHEIQVPTLLMAFPLRRTVYHYNMTPSIPEQLWKAGFRDINGLDANGLPSLVMPRLGINVNMQLELIAWYQSKGADFHIRRDLGLWREYHQGLPNFYDRNTTSLHIVSWKTGNLITSSFRNRFGTFGTNPDFDAGSDSDSDRWQTGLLQIRKVFQRFKNVWSYFA